MLAALSPCYVAAHPFQIWILERHDRDHQLLNRVRSFLDVCRHRRYWARHALPMLGPSLIKYEKFEIRPFGEVGPGAASFTGAARACEIAWGKVLDDTSMYACSQPPRDRRSFRVRSGSLGLQQEEQVCIAG